MAPTKTVMGAPVHVKSDRPHSESEITPYDERIRQIIRNEETKRQEADRSHDERLRAIEESNREIRKEVGFSNRLQWAIGVVVTLVGVYVGWKSATQQSSIVEAAAVKTEAIVDSKLRQHLEETRQSNLDVARQALRLEQQEREARANPPPIGRAPDRVAASNPTR